MSTKKITTLTEAQKELEAPVKGYQLKELTDKFGEMKNEFSKKLDRIINETTGVATKAQLDEKAREIEIDIKSYVDDEIKKIHLIYAPIKNAAIWVIGVVVVALIGQIVFQIWR